MHSSYISRLTDVSASDSAGQRAMAAEHWLSIELPSARFIVVTASSHPLCTHSIQPISGAQSACGLEGLCERLPLLQSRALQHVPCRRCCSAQLGNPSSSSSLCCLVNQQPIRLHSSTAVPAPPCCTMLRQLDSGRALPSRVVSPGPLCRGQQLPPATSKLLLSRPAADLPPIVQLPRCGSWEQSAAKCSLRLGHPARAAPHRLHAVSCGS